MTVLKPKVADYLIIGAILLAGIGGFFLNLQSAAASDRKYAQVYLENELVAELSLGPGETYKYSFSFGSDGEHEAVLEIADGQVRMLPLGEKLCPRASCSHTGWIEHGYESIVCLPNRIMVVFSDKSPADIRRKVDGTTY